LLQEVLTQAASDLGVGEAALFNLDKVCGGQVRQAARLHPLLGLVQPLELGQEPGVDVGQLEELLLCKAILERLRQTP
jgi:hypothetical protein